MMQTDLGENSRRKRRRAGASSSVPPQSKSASGRAPNPIKNSKGEIFYEVESIVKENEDGTSLLVKWVGYTEKTWQQRSELPRAILDLWDQQKVVQEQKLDWGTPGDIL